MPLGNTLSIAFDPSQAISLKLLDQLALCRFWIGDQRGRPVEWCKSRGPAPA
jgi:hypothetical protein